MQFSQLLSLAAVAAPLVSAAAVVIARDDDVSGNYCHILPNWMLSINKSLQSPTPLPT